MTFIHYRRPLLEKTFYRLPELAKLTRLPTDALLEQAIRGRIKLFVRIPPEVTPYSVHEHAIDILDSSILAHKAVSNVTPDPLDSMPFNMLNYALIGVSLSTIDCTNLLSEGFLRQSLFREGIRIVLMHGEYVQPIDRNALYGKSRLHPGGWRIAFYRNSHNPVFREKIGYSRPEIFEIELHDIFAISTTVERFLDDIDTNKYIEELIEDDHIVHIDDRPAYFSERLNQVLDAHWFYQRAIKPELVELIWSGKMLHSRSSKEKREKAIDSVRAAHAQFENSLNTNEFQKHLQKGQTAEKLIKAAARFIAPLAARGALREFTDVRKDFDLSNTFDDPYQADPKIPYLTITPEIKALVAGAKLFWGQPSLDLNQSNTHPHRKDVVNFMKHLGFGSGDAEHAATIISHTTALGRPATVRHQVHASLKPLESLMHNLRKK